MFPGKLKYNDCTSIYWKCAAGHQWESPVIARTLFNMECPICNPNNVIPIGSSHGCLTIIGDPSIYEKEIAASKIAEYEKDKENFLQEKRTSNSNIDSAEFSDRKIEEIKKEKLYQVKCKCGSISFISETDFLQKRHRYCSESCGLKEKHKKDLLESYKRVPDKSYDIDFTHTFHESLEVLECIDEHYEELTGGSDKRKKGGGTYTVYKKYRCKCYLCRKEMTAKSSQFHISPPTAYGSTAYNGYYSGICCDCHKISSFQWIVNKILKENNISYRVEVTFPDLYGVGNTNLLRYDFAVKNLDGTIKCLIECQGEQHYKPIDEFGGITQYEIQKKNDELKRRYATEHGIMLLEIPYKSKKYENIEKLLRLNDII